jgi:hypothetical protein
MMPHMELLDQAIKAAGGVSALARHLGVKPNTVSNWQVRGLPHAYSYLFRFMREKSTGLFDVSNVINPD